MLEVASAMQTKVETVSPDLDLVELERRLLAAGCSGFPVVEEGRLVGIVSRSDIVRAIAVERATEEQLSDFYRSFAEPDGSSGGDAEAAAIESRVGARAAHLRVRDVMIRDVKSVERNQPLADVAKRMVEAHIHRLPVVDGERLVGIVTTLDIARLVAEGRLAAT